MLSTNLLKLLLPLVAIAVMLLVARKRGVSRQTDLGLIWPRPIWAVIWLGAWIILIAVEELISPWIGMPAAKPWAAFPWYLMVVRIAAIGIVGPIAEELAFRGMLLQALRKTRLQTWLAVAIVAAVWSTIHLQYEPLILAMIFIDGLVLGAARVQTRSLWVPIAMHIVGNLFSIYQSVSG